MAQSGIRQRVRRLARRTVRRLGGLARRTGPGRRRHERQVVGIIEDLMLTPSRRGAYYRFAHVMTSLFDEAGIRYVAFAGTMLGGVRHEGMIPWDDDLDFAIPEADVPLLLALLDRVEDYGIRRNRRLEGDPGVFQFMPFGAPIMGPERGYLGLDVFVLSEVEVPGVGTVLHHKSAYFRTKFFRQWIRPEELSPRRRFSFGPLRLWGPGDPSGYLERSGFALDVATIKSHGDRREVTARAVKRLKAIGGYPVRTAQVLAMRPPHDVDAVLELDAYRVGCARGERGRVHLRRPHGRS